MSSVTWATANRIESDRFLLSLMNRPSLLGPVVGPVHNAVHSSHTALCGAARARPAAQGGRGRGPVGAVGDLCLPPRPAAARVASVDQVFFRQVSRPRRRVSPVCVDDIWMIKSVRNIASRAAVLSRKATTKCVVRDRCVRDLLSQSAGRPTLAYYVYRARYKVRRPTDSTTKSVTGVPACCCGLADFH